MKALICIPTYNEKDNVLALADEVFRACSEEEVDILFIDDNSPDGTGAILDEMAQKNSRVHVLHRAGKLGLATAYIQGFRWGLERGFDWFFEMDADFSHDPKHLPQFFKLFKKGDCDVVCGSRYIDGGGVSNWDQRRLLLSRLGSIYSRMWLQYPLQDWTGGFNAWNRRAVEFLHLETVASKGYAFQIEMKYRAVSLGLRLCETPIIFQERRAGHSKMSGSIVKEAILGVFLLKWKNAEARLFAG